MKTIVTHFAPDVDAVASIWLLKRFLPGWENAELKYVPAGNTYNNEIADSNPEILHVDTGWGMLDHHQTSADTCAAKRTLEYILDCQEKSRSKSSKARKLNDHKVEALERLVEVVNDIDHFREIYYPNPASDLYDFSLVGMMDGWKLIFSDDNDRLAELGMIALDGIFKKFQDKVWAEKEIKDEGVPFDTGWGKGIGIETINDEVVRLAQKMGYVIAVRKDPKKRYVRIKAVPSSEADLTSAYEKYRKLDSQATWYLHSGKKMILNGSVKNPESRPTKLTLREIIEVLKK